MSSSVVKNSAPRMLVPVVVTHSPLSDCDVVSPPVRMLSTIAMGMTRMIRNAVVTRFSCSG